MMMAMNKSRPKEHYLGDKVDYDYPALDTFQLLIMKGGIGGRLWWKSALRGFFLQTPICPSEYYRTGFIWRANYFFFVASIFGLCHARLAGQCITSAVNWIHK